MRNRTTVTGFTRFAAVAAGTMLLASPMLARADTIEMAPETIVCETAPIEAARYAEAAADPGDDVGIPEPVPYAAPAGTVAGAAVIDEVNAVLEQVVACVNEGRTRSFLNLFTTGWLSTNVAEFGDLPEDEAPEPIDEDERLSLVAMSDVVVQADGQVVALVIFDQSEREATELTSVMTFAEVDGRLMIDEWQPVTIAEGSPSTPVVDAWERVAGEAYTGVIAPLDRAPTFRIGSGNAASGWWLPTAEEVAALEEALPGYLAGLDDARANVVAGRVGTYLRQYAGLVVEGRAVIFVNALCEDPTGGRWTSEPVFVDDGGDCFFQVYWEPATREFRGLTINGEA